MQKLADISMFESLGNQGTQVSCFNGFGDSVRQAANTVRGFGDSVRQAANTVRARMPLRLGGAWEKTDGGFLATRDLPRFGSYQAGARREIRSIAPSFKRLSALYKKTGIAYSSALRGLRYFKECLDAYADQADMLSKMSGSFGRNSNFRGYMWDVSGDMGSWIRSVKEFSKGLDDRRVYRLMGLATGGDSDYYSPLF